MLFTCRTTAMGAAALALAVGFAAPAQAGYIVTLTEVADPSQLLGSDVVASGSGAIDLAGLTAQAKGGLFTTRIIPDGGAIFIGPPGNLSGDSYGGFTGPTSSFGSGSQRSPNSGGGVLAGIDDGVASHFPELVVPAGYVSGSLSDTSTYNNATFASLGVTPGTYKWTWGTSANDGSFTLQIGPAAVPEPASLALLAMGLAGLGMALRLRRA